MSQNMRTESAANYLCLSKSTLDKLRCYGGGPRYFKLGRAVIYNSADLDLWRDERAVLVSANDNMPASEARTA